MQNLSQIILSHGDEGNEFYRRNNQIINWMTPNLNMRSLSMENINKSLTPIDHYKLKNCLLSQQCEPQIKNSIENKEKSKITSR